MILTLEPTRSPNARNRVESFLRTPQLFLAVPSSAANQSAFVWPDWLSPAAEGQDASAMQLIPLTTSRRSRSK